MNKPYIEFRKNSDFSNILTDTFGFIRNEFKPLIRTIINIAGPAILVYLLALSVYNYVASDVFIFSDFGEPSFNSGSVFATFMALILYLISGIAAYIFLVSSVLHYIKSYVNNKGIVEFSEVKSEVYKSFWSFFGLGFLKGITIGIALLLCLLPALYFMVPMAVIYSIYVFEKRTSVTDAYSKSYSLVNADFWTAWGSILVLGIIYFVVIYVFAIFSSIYTMAGTGILSGEVDPADFEELGRDPVLILLSIIQTIVQLFLNLILIVGGATIYFHLHEKTTFTGTYERISEIGKTED